MNEGLPSRLPVGLPHRSEKSPPMSQPLYTANNLHPAFSLRYDWTGWPTEGVSLPSCTAAIARDAAATWESDGLRLLEAHVIFVCMTSQGGLVNAVRIPRSAAIRFVPSR